MLGDIVNPIIEERKLHTLLSHREALTQFMQYAEGCRLLGHNADYDWHILDHNLRRYAPEYRLEQSHPDYLDSLRLVRLLHPELREHKLKYLLTALGLEGTNSHLADDDVNATRSASRIATAWRRRGWSNNSRSSVTPVCASAPNCCAAITASCIARR